MVCIVVLLFSVPSASAYVQVRPAQRLSPRLLRHGVQDAARNAATVRSESLRKTGLPEEPLVRHTNAVSGITFLYPESWNVFDTTAMRPYYDRGTLRTRPFIDIEIYKRTDKKEAQGDTLNDVSILFEMDSGDPDDPSLEDIRFEIEQLNEEGSIGPRSFFRSENIVIDGYKGVRYSYVLGHDVADTVTTIVRWKDDGRNASYLITYTASRYSFER